MRYEGSIPRALFLVLALLTLVAGAFALRAAWETIPKAEAQQSAEEALDSRLQEPGPIQEPGPQQGPQGQGLQGQGPQGGNLMNAGGPTDGPVPVMPDGNCPEEFPVQLNSGCYP